MPLLQTLKCELNGHRFAGWQSPRAGDCTQVRGYECGREQESRILHAWGDWEYLTAENCEQIRTCPRDGATEREVRHAWGEYRGLGDETHLAVCGHCRHEEVQPHDWESSQWEQYDWERDVRDNTCRQCGHVTLEVGYISP